MYILHQQTIPDIKFSNFSDRIMLAGFALIFVLVEIKMMQEIRRIMEFSADRIRGVRCIICEKKSAKSKDLINRSRNTFAAGKTEDGTIIYADCTIRQYEQIIVNETTGLLTANQCVLQKLKRGLSQMWILTRNTVNGLRLKTLMI